MKRIFYYTDVLPILSKREVALEKIKYNLSVFEEHKEDVQLVWHPYAKMQEYLEKNDSPMLDAYTTIVEEFKSAGWGIFDDSEDAIASLQSCDAYYGDVSDLVYYATESHKPAMLINYECMD